MQVNIAPELLRWAYQRAKLDDVTLQKHFPKLKDWEQGKSHPTLKQLESFAKKTHVPLGVFFLSEPPQEQLPIPDYRTAGSTPLNQPSPELLETIYLCQQRQAWYIDHIKSHQAEPLDFVGSTTLNADIIQIAAEIRRTLCLDLEQRKQISTLEDSLYPFIEQIERQGILVMVSGVVESNNNRQLDPEEFRGFALVDKYAPLIFINAKDTKAAQIFTLAHELAHTWLGKEGVSNIQIQTVDREPEKQVERWCNQVAAELLVPLKNLEETYLPDEELQTEIDRLKRRYKVSTLVILRRLYDLKAIKKGEFKQIYHKELTHLKEKIRSNKGSSNGGNYYRTLRIRASKRFVNALVSSTLEGQTLFRDAFKMLGIKKFATFESLRNKCEIFT